MAKLLAGSKWQEVPWHGWRRLCAATLYQARTPMPSINAWCGWRSTQTARGYTECPEEGTIKLVHGPEPQIQSARTCSQRGPLYSKSTMSGLRDCSPTTSSAIATTTMTTGSAAQVPWGAVTPRPEPEDECPRKCALEGQEPDLVGRSPDGGHQPAKWNTFLDPNNGRPCMASLKTVQNPGVESGVANGLKVTRSQAFRAVLRTQKALRISHKGTVDNDAGRCH